ncbi:MAG: nucleoside deaminase [Candidatus Manganitrophus sp.]|nr:nucleoside deaminase [Candidatus Manganitrophus sp.]
MRPTDQDEQYMRLALKAAEAAFDEGEVPVGAVLVCKDATIFTAYNLKERQHDPTAHAEMLVLRKGAEMLGRWRLGGTLYVTLEPCAMCAGALDPGPDRSPGLRRGRSQGGRLRVGDRSGTGASVQSPDGGDRRGSLG